ncbi:MAG: molybdopterin-binding protein [Deltaproteobacteria bacterium]|nr:molybdopterin-binding protein [Deltaproteobacteria bacterium]
MTHKYKSSATVIPVEQALGKVLAHDITEIRPGQFKGTAFKKGHIIRENDIAHLIRLGKQNIYILHIEPGELHEDDAAIKIADALAGPGIIYNDRPSEGKISLKSAHRGLLKVNVEALTELNLVPDISCSSRHNNVFVEEGEIIAATRAIPLIIDEDTVNKAAGIARAAGGIFSVKRLSQLQAGLIVTGNEVYNGLIEDKFAPIIRKKLRFFGCHLKDILFSTDDNDNIVRSIQELREKKLGLILVAGGMSVDPDDKSRTAIRDAGVEDIIYGTPVFPGAMFLYGRAGNVPVLGLPGCVLFHRTTVLDLVLPRILAGENITRRDAASMAHGGLCLGCEECRFPACPFGK